MNLLHLVWFAFFTFLPCLFLESPTLYSASLSGTKLQFNTIHLLCFWWKSWLVFFIHLGLSWFIYASSKIFSFSKSDDPSSISRLVAKKKSLLLVNPGNFIPLTFQRRLSLFQSMLLCISQSNIRHGCLGGCGGLDKGLVCSHSSQYNYKVKLEFIQRSCTVCSVYII